MDNEKLHDLSDTELIKYANSILEHRYNKGHAWHIDFTMMAVVGEFINRLKDKKKYDLS